MSEAINRFHEFVLAEFIDPNHRSDEDLDSIIEALKDDELWRARALVVKQAITGDCPPDSQEAVLATYATLAKDNDPAALAEAARAAAVFEETELLWSYLERAQAALGFSPKLTGIEVKFSPHQAQPALRMACLAASTQPSEDQPSLSAIENVPLTASDDRFPTPEILSSEDRRLSESPLANLENVLLLLHSVHYRQNNASATSVLNEQALPYVRRVTDAENFARLNCGVQKHALFDRSIMEMKDINELERGTVQLMKIGTTLQNQTSHDESLKYFHLMVPLSWKTVDENAARRLVAMSDFGNAIPIYRRLGKKFDLAVSLAASDKVDEALAVLKEIQPADGHTLMLMADLSADPGLWHQAWDQFKEPKAKLRLARVALSQNQPQVALDHLNDLLAVSATDHEALLLASNTALSLQQWGPAVTYLKRALALNEDDAMNWSNLGTALLQTGHPESALHAIQQALRVNQNPDPHLPTLANYISLSAQLKQWDEVVVGLIKLVNSADKGSVPYIAKVSPIFPSVVNHYVAQKYTKEGMQTFVLNLFTEKLAAVVPADDPMLLRLDAKLYVWSENYQAGLKHYVDAVDAILKSGAEFASDNRARARLELYAAEALDALEKYGDKPGRIEGSKAYPGWKTKVHSIEQAVKRVSSN